MADPETEAVRGEGESFLARSAVRIALALLIGIGGAAAARGMGLPLPYLLGPLLACGTAAMAGVPLAVAPCSRELAQLVVGLAIGLRFVPAVMVATGKLLPLMVLATVATMVATTLAAVLLERLGGTDRKTAFLATAAAGVAEMAVVAEQQGGDRDTVSVVHLVRLVGIVTTVPFLVTLFGAPGAIENVPVALENQVLPIAVLLGLGGVASLLAQPLQVPNRWLLVPTALGALVAGAGFGPFAVPAALLVAAQIVIGIWLGCRIRRDLVGRLPRITASAVATTAFLVAAAGVVAWLLSMATGLSFATSLLAVAPAGITEMALTATAMHLDAATVTAFQIMRIAVVVTTVLFALKAFERLSRRIGGVSS
jgi:membrane AbrB-like protein